MPPSASRRATWPPPTRPPGPARRRSFHGGRSLAQPDLLDRGNVRIRCRRCNLETEPRRLAGEEPQRQARDRRVRPAGPADLEALEEAGHPPEGVVPQERLVGSLAHGEMLAVAVGRRPRRLVRKHVQELQLDRRMVRPLHLLLDPECPVEAAEVSELWTLAPRLRSGVIGLVEGAV